MSDHMFEIVTNVERLLPKEPRLFNKRTRSFLVADNESYSRVNSLVFPLPDGPVIACMAPRYKAMSSLWGMVSGANSFSINSVEDTPSYEGGVSRICPPCIPEPGPN